LCEFDFARLPNSIKLNPWIEFNLVQLSLIENTVQLGLIDYARKVENRNIGKLEMHGFKNIVQIVMTVQLFLLITRTANFKWTRMR